ncbi:hypothetical protein AVEN_113290-1 [Araneus ventricosus]|uniref:Uncharacterized protein n=1 Tax=Araneus ventricosus TaxID=182803 RepID=A0A4Y2RHZ7_ARAVE|nr:hypothetical protein AVEN_113290-1 [Araneus ventricosus]
MAKILKQLVFGQKKNPPAPPMPDYQGEEAAKGEFADHDYENISKFTSEVRGSVRFQEPKEPENSGLSLEELHPNNTPPGFALDLMFCKCKTPPQNMVGLMRNIFH